MKRTEKILIALISIALMFQTGSVYALSNLNSYDPNPSINNSGTFIDKVEPILGFIRDTGMIVSVVALSIIGLKYMITSPQEKADYKKEMIPFIVGCTLIGSITAILKIIELALK